MMSKPTSHEERAKKITIHEIYIRCRKHKQDCHYERLIPVKEYHQALQEVERATARSIIQTAGSITGNDSDIGQRIATAIREEFKIDETT